MKKQELIQLLAEEPIIAAVKDEQGLSIALHSNAEVLFLLFGDIVTIGNVVSEIHIKGKKAIVHLDLIEGLAPKEVSVDFIAQHTSADGIISTKGALTKRAKNAGLVSIQRIFLLDSMALKNAARYVSDDSSDFIEILPGLMPKIIRHIRESTGKPIIAGGLISDKEDIIAALDAGAIGVSSTNQDVWNM